MSVKSLDTGQQLAVVPAGDQDLGVCAGGGLQEGQRASGELMLLNKSDLIFPVRYKMQDQSFSSFFSFSFFFLVVCDFGMHGNVKCRRRVQRRKTPQFPAIRQKQRKKEIKTGRIGAIGERVSSESHPRGDNVRELALRLVEQISVGASG